MIAGVVVAATATAGVVATAGATLPPLEGAEPLEGVLPPPPETVTVTAEVAADSSPVEFTALTLK